MQAVSPSRAGVSPRRTAAPGSLLAAGEVTTPSSSRPVSLYGQELGRGSPARAAHGSRHADAAGRPASRRRAAARRSTELAKRRTAYRAAPVSSRHSRRIRRCRRWCRASQYQHPARTSIQEVLHVVGAAAAVVPSASAFPHHAQVCGRDGDQRRPAGRTARPTRPIRRGQCSRYPLPPRTLCRRRAADRIRRRREARRGVGRAMFAPSMITRPHELCGRTSMAAGRSLTQIPPHRPDRVAQRGRPRSQGRLR